MPDPKIVLYTRLGCHLCDDAKAMLESYSLTVESVDIDRNPQLVERYDQCVPVVFVDGRERFRGRIDPVLLRRLIGRR